MCWYNLNICPFPDHDAISALIFNPSKAGGWVPCNEIKPWGRLSCGCLTVTHPIKPTKSPMAKSFEHILKTQTNRPMDMESPKHKASAVPQERSSTETTVVPSDADDNESQRSSCSWCTTVLKLVSTRFKEVQGEARNSLYELEAMMKTSPEWLDVQNEIKLKNQELAEMKQHAWNMSQALVNEAVSRDEAEE